MAIESTLKPEGLRPLEGRLLRLLKRVPQFTGWVVICAP